MVLWTRDTWKQSQPNSAFFPHWGTERFLHCAVREVHLERCYPSSARNGNLFLAKEGPRRARCTSWLFHMPSSWVSTLEAVLAHPWDSASWQGGNSSMRQWPQISKEWGSELRRSKNLCGGREPVPTKTSAISQDTPTVCQCDPFSDGCPPALPPTNSGNMIGQSLKDEYREWCQRCHSIPKSIYSAGCRGTSMSWRHQDPPSSQGDPTPALFLLCDFIFMCPPELWCAGRRWLLLRWKSYLKDVPAENILLCCIKHDEVCQRVTFPSSFKGVHLRNIRLPCH